MPTWASRIMEMSFPAVADSEGDGGRKKVSDCKDEGGFLGRIGASTYYGVHLQQKLMEYFNEVLVGFDFDERLTVDDQHGVGDAVICEVE